MIHTYRSVSSEYRNVSRMYQARVSRGVSGRCIRCVSSMYLQCIECVSQQAYRLHVSEAYRHMYRQCIKVAYRYSVSQTYRSTYRGCIRKTYHRTRIARVSHYVSHAYQAYVSSHVYRERIWYRIRAYQCLYLQRRDICVAACISDSIRVYRQCIGYMYRDVS